MLIESRGLGTGQTLIHGTLRAGAQGPRARRSASRSIACCCCSRARCSRMPRPPICGGCRRLPGRSRSPPDKEAMPRGSEAAILIVLSGSLQVETGAGMVGTATAGDVIGMYETLGGSEARRHDHGTRDHARAAPRSRCAVRAAGRSHRPATGRVLDAPAAARARRSSNDRRLDALLGSELTRCRRAAR